MPPKTLKRGGARTALPNNPSETDSARHRITTTPAPVVALAEDGPALQPSRPRDTEALQLARQGPIIDADVPPIGFNNPGNLCYRNAVLALLMNIPALIGYIQRCHIPMEYTSDTITTGEENMYGRDHLLKTLGDLANQYWSAAAPNVKQQECDKIIQDFWERLALQSADSHGPQGSFYTRAWKLDKEEKEEDANEFLLYLFQNMTEQSKTSLLEELTFRSLFETRKALIRVCNKNCNNGGVLSDDTDVSSIWTVNLIREKGEAFKTLEEALAASMEDDTNYDCPKCNEDGKRKGSRGIGHTWRQIYDTSEVIFMSLSQWGQQSKKSGYRKENRVIAIPEVLDLKELLYQDPHLDAPRDRQVRYQLAGVVSHAGTKGTGHYVTHVRGLDGAYYKLDDEQVSKSSIEGINNNPFKYRGKYVWTPYILAYTKIHNEKGNNEGGNEGGHEGGSGNGQAGDGGAAAGNLTGGTVRARLVLDGFEMKFSMQLEGNEFDLNATEHQADFQVDLVDDKGNVVEDLTGFFLKVKAKKGLGKGAGARKGAKSSTKKKSNGKTVPVADPNRKRKRKRTEDDVGENRYHLRPRKGK